MKALKRISIVLAVVFALVLIFYAEEDWRGRHAWQKCKHEFEAKGFVLDWDKLIPPPVPDDQNFFKAPKMTEWFVKGAQTSTNGLSSRLSNKKTDSIGTATNAITTEAGAREYLAWSDQFQSDFDLIRDALKRPYARIDCDYHAPFDIKIPNFVTVRIIAKTLAQRAHCHLLLNQPEQALADLTLMHDFCRLLEGAPTGKPMTLVAAMINVAVAGVDTDAVAEGMRRHVWQEPQLVELQKQFAEVNLTPFVLEALRTEPVAMCRTAEIAWIPKMFDMTRKMNWSDKFKWWFWPRGWTYQNMINVVEIELKPLGGFDPAQNTISPRVFDEASRDLNRFLNDKSPFKLLAIIAIPNYSRAWQTTAHNQMMVNEAQIVCALERYRLAHGQYPEMLDALAPQFIENLPHDIIGGAPLIYHPTADGKFLLYSVGWNEKDDGGTSGGTDFTKADWVWKN